MSESPDPKGSQEAAAGKEAAARKEATSGGLGARALGAGAQGVRARGARALGARARGALGARARVALRRGRSRIQRYPKLVRAGIYLGRLGAQLWKKTVDDDCLDRAASLAYTTVLAIVPLLAVSFLVFRLSGAFDDLEAEIRQWMLESLLAESVGSVSEVLDAFLSRVSAGAVGVTGAVMLVVTAIWLFVTAEVTLNHIWRVAKPRSLVARFTTFWALLTLGPLGLGVGFYLSVQLGQTPLGRLVESTPWALSALRLFLPFLLSAAVLALIYKLGPHTRVKWRAALVGGLVAGLLFELSKRGFNLYVTQIYQGSTTTRIYGAFALFPVFLLWIYILWLVLLFGAVVAYTVQHLDLLYDEQFRERAAALRGEGAALSPYLVCRLLLLVSYRHHRGDPPLTKEALTKAVRAEERTVYQGLERLERGGILLAAQRSGEAVWIPARDIGAITLDDALRAFAAAGLGPDPEEPSPDAQALEDLFCDLQVAQREVAGEVTFRDLAETIRPEGLALLFEQPPGLGSPQPEPEPEASALASVSPKKPPDDPPPQVAQRPPRDSGDGEEV